MDALFRQNRCRCSGRRAAKLCVTRKWITFSTTELSFIHWYLHSRLFDSLGEPRGAVACMLDMTDRKNAETALKEADRRKDEFLATLAHELRNPLAPIRNGLQLMQMSDSSGLPTDELHEMMERQVSHLVRLVDDLLEVSRISRGKIELKRERISLATVIGHAVEAM